MQNLNTKKYIIIAISLILIATGCFIIFKNIGNNGDVPVSGSGKSSVTTLVKEETYQETISASGTVYLENEVSIYPDEEGIVIQKFLVEVGDVVEEGQIIAEYDIESKKETLETTIRNLETNLKNEQLNLQNMLLPITEQEKISLENSVIQAEKALLEATTALNNYDTNLEQKEQAINDALVSLETAQRTYEQNLALYEIGAVTQTSLNDSKNAVEKAQVNYNNAISSLEEFKNSKASLELSVRSAENNLKQSQLKLAEADDPLSTDAAKISYQKLLNSIESIENDLATNRQKLAELPYYAYSTSSGTVTEMVDEGSKTEDNKAIMKVADFKQLIVKASISEYDVPNIAVGQAVEMTSDGIEDKIYYGTITKVNPSATSKSSNLGSETVVDIEISIDNADEVLKPGYTLDLEIVTLSQENVIVLNSNSILKDNQTGESYVFTIVDGKVVKTKVEVATLTSTKVQVLSGLKAKDEIITSASNEIQEGMTLEEVSTLNASSTTSSTSTESQQGVDAGFEMRPTDSGSGARPADSGSGGRPMS